MKTCPFNLPKQVLAKFHRFLFRVYKDLQKKDTLAKLKTLVHGDAKIDNFMLKKVYGENDVFTAMLIDWQVGCKMLFIIIVIIISNI